MPRYEFSDGKSHKFWEVTVTDDSYTVRFGKIGTEGQTQTKIFSSPEEANKEAEKAAQSKMKKGYQLVGEVSSPQETDSLSNPELEAAIFENPEDSDSWAVYGDWLMGHDEARGEAVALGVALAKDESNEELRKRQEELYKRNEEAWLGNILLKGLKAETDGPPVVQLEWRYGFIWKARVSTEYDFEGPKTNELLRALLKNPSSRFLNDLTIGITEGMEDGDASFSDCINTLAKGGKRPSLRKFHLGDFEADECEISWSSIGQVDKVFPVMPNLETLIVHGGSIEFEHFRHPKLKSLTLETGGLPAETVRSLSTAEFPLLESLEVWLGSDDYGGDSTISDLKPIFSNTNLPMLRNLGLQNSEYQNDIAALIVDAPILKQLKRLNLSMGTMTDEGGKALLEGAAALQHLEDLDVSDNFIREGVVAELKEKFGSRITIGDQEEYDDDDPYLYTSVGE